MKRYVVTIISIVVLAVALVSFGQREEREGERPERARGGERRGMFREAQMKAIATAEEELGKMKSGMESLTGVRERWQGLSDEEREELREKFRKMRGERQQSIAVIEEQIARLKGGRQLRAEHEEYIVKLNAIRELAVKEKAKETAAKIDELIAEKKKEFEDRLQKLGLQRRPRREGD